MQQPILVGAVAYDPKVVVIWDIIKDFFESSGCPMDYLFFSNYELQVQALQLLPPEHLFLNPDCGFGTFSARPMNTPDIVRAKLRALRQAAQILREM